MIKQEYIRFRWDWLYYYKAIDRGMWTLHGPWYSHHTGAGTVPMLEVIDQSVAEKAWEEYRTITNNKTTMQVDILTL